MMNRFWMAAYVLLFILVKVIPASAQSDIFVPQTFIDKDGTASICLLRAETPPPASCQQDAMSREQVQDSRMPQDSRIPVSQVCKKVKDLANPSPVDEYYIMLLDKQGRWIQRDGILCRAGNQQVVRPADPGRLADPGSVPAGTGVACSPQELCRQIQNELAKLGLYTGYVDGKPGRGTRQAIEAFQKQRQFPVTGELTQDQVKILLSGFQSGPQDPIAGISNKVRQIQSEIGSIPLCFGACGYHLRTIFDLTSEIDADLRQLANTTPRAPAPASQQAAVPADPPKVVAERCLRIDPAPGASNAETFVVLGDRGLTFRLIKSPQDGDVMVGLSPSTSQRLHARAGELFVNPTLARPVNLNKAVPETLRRIGDFKLQTNLIDPELFKKFVKADPKAGALDPRQVSYSQAKEFIDGINAACKGKASFRLPKEEELTYLLMLVYYPNNMDGRIQPDELKSCASLQRPESAFRNVFADLAGSYWQLTDSTCEKFNSASPAPSCSGGKVIKGGTEQSSADECLPQFRGEVSPGIPNPRTSFRLVLEN